jgi:zeta-carotene isomerase
VLVGEDSAAFELKDQSVASWAYFAGILGAVLVALNVLWIDPSTGVGTKFLDAVASVSDSHEVRTLYLRGFRISLERKMRAPSGQSPSNEIKK